MYVVYGWLAVRGVSKVFTLLPPGRRRCQGRLGWRQGQGRALLSFGRFCKKRVNIESLRDSLLAPQACVASRRGVCYAARVVVLGCDFSCDNLCSCVAL